MSWVLEIIDDMKNKYKKDNWKSAIYKDIVELTVDARGNVGEIMIFEKLLPSIGITDIIYNKDNTTTENTYDGIALGKKIEVKTATVGSGKGRTFQHENFYLDETGADVYVLVDICENEYFLSFYKKEDLIRLKEIIGITVHSRHSTGARKLTISSKKLETTSTEKGHTMRLTEEMTETAEGMEIIKTFVNKHLGRVA